MVSYNFSHFNFLIKIIVFSAMDYAKILGGASCPIDSYCLNGGTCVFYAAIGELSCRYYVKAIPLFFTIPENMMGPVASCVVLSSEMKLFFRCATGYLGKRCEQKDPYSGKSAVRNSHWRSSRCLLGITHYPC